MDTLLTPQLLEVIKDKSILTPTVKLLSYQGKKIIRKDYAERPWWIKKTLGAAMANNEFSILRRLEGIKGIPKAVGKTSYGLLIEYVEGGFLHKFRPGGLTYETIGKIETLIAQIHSRNVVHLDLAQRKNILISSDLTPYIIDFANAFFLRPQTPMAKAFLYYLRLIDKNSLLKFKNRYFPGKMTADEKKSLENFWAIRRWWVFSPKTFRKRDRV